MFGNLLRATGFLLQASVTARVCRAGDERVMSGSLLQEPRFAAPAIHCETLRRMHGCFERTDCTYSQQDIRIRFILPIVWVMFCACDPFAPILFRYMFGYTVAVLQPSCQRGGRYSTNSTQ